MLLSTPQSCHALNREYRGVRLPVPLCSGSSAVRHVFALDPLQTIVKEVSMPPELLITALFTFLVFTVLNKTSTF